MKDTPKVLIVDERGNELTPKEVKVDEDANGVFLVTVTINDADLSGERTFGT